MKKTIVLLYFFGLINTQLVAQNTKDSVDSGMNSYYFSDFDLQDWSFIEIDTTQPNNLWQVGKPSKQKLNSSFSGYKVLITDTVNNINQPNKSSFIFKFYRPWYYNVIESIGINFYFHADFDSLSGIKVELSYDKGHTWKNLWRDSVSYCNHANIGCYNPDTAILPDGSEIVRFSEGEDSIGQFGTHYACTWPCAGSVYSVFLKFTYVNTGTGNNVEGILLDDILIVVGHWCEFIGVDEIDSDFSLQVLPNPVMNNSVLKVPVEFGGTYNLEIVNINGLKIREYAGMCDNEIIIRKQDFVPGYYFIKLWNNNKIFKGKFIIEH